MLMMSSDRLTMLSNVEAVSLSNHNRITAEASLPMTLTQEWPLTLSDLIL